MPTFAARPPVWASFCPCRLTIFVCARWCRFWTLEEALFEARRLSAALNEAHNSACKTKKVVVPAGEKAQVNAVDALLRGWVVGVGTGSDHAFKGCVPQRKKARHNVSSAGGLAIGTGAVKMDEAQGSKEDDNASDLWCKACIDDPEVTYCGFCGCRVRGVLGDIYL
jgi:hypothetical protein